MKKKSQKIFIIFLLITAAFISEIFKLKVLAADYFLKQVVGKIIIETTNFGKAWYIFPADNRRYYLGRPKDAFLLAKNLAIEASSTEIRQLKINSGFIDQKTKDTDQDTLSDNLESWLGTNPNNQDTDQDGYPDNIEVINGYSPNSSSKTKVVANNNVAKKLAGNFVFNKNLPGLWYINPVNLQAYFIENDVNMLKLMQRVAMGIDSTSLQRIEGLVIGPEYMSEEIKNKETTPEPKTNTLRYTDNSNQYSFSFPKDWTIKKYPDAPNLINVTDANRDFIAENKASIILQIINMGTSSTLANFKTKYTDGNITVSQEITKTIQNRQSYSRLTVFPHMRKKSIVIDLLNGHFLDISLNTAKNISNYDSTFDTIVNSLTF